MSNKVCAVCKIQVFGSHDHYGCKEVCSSCRNFFRRAVAKQIFTQFQCKIKLNEDGIRSEKCVINSKDRSSCKKCRFQNCLQAGMNPKWVSPSQSQELTSVKKNQKSLRSIEMTFTLEENEYVQHLYTLFNNAGVEYYFNMYQSDPGLLLNWLKEVLRGGFLSFQVIDQLQKADNLCLQYSLWILPFFKELSLPEKTQLLQENISKIIALIWALGTNFDDCTKFFEDIIQLGKQRPHCFGMDHLQEVFQQIGSEHDWSQCNTSAYDLVFSSPWALDSGIEEKHFEISKCLRRCCRNSHDNKLDQLQMALIIFIILLDSSDLILTQEQKARIEKVQMNQILLLQRYLKAYYPKEAGARFGSGLMALSYSKELRMLDSFRLKI